MKYIVPSSRWRRVELYVFLAALILIALPLALRANPQAKPFSGKDRDRGLQMLEIIKEGIEEYYYDPNFHGVDLKARYKVAEGRIKKASSNGEVFSIIAGLLLEFNDSHLNFIPPNRITRVEYGWQMQMFGDKCYVVSVKPGSDVERNGLKVGDEVWSIDGYEPTRENLWKIKYSYYTLNPRAGMRIVVQDPGGGQRELIAMAKFTSAEDFFATRKKKTPDPPQFHEVNSDLFVWKMRSFSVEEKVIDEAMKRALPFKTMILDLRGNGGGYEKSLLRLLGYFFDGEVKLGDITRRKGTKPLVAKPRGKDKYFAGKLIVLVDCNSASAAEMFARVVQLQKRGIVIGDHSSGKVMRSIIHGESTFRGPPAAFTFSFFAVNITDADITMTDGKSLEHTGVTPDHLLLPSAGDLAAQRDPVLAYAASLLGVKIDPKEAGALFVRAQEEEEDEEKDKDDEGEDKKKPGN